MIRKSLDTEVTGVDVYHGATPFLVTFCNERFENTWWEWDVDPLTRKVYIPPDDVEAIIAEIEEADELDFQNGKFDVTTLLNSVLPKGYKWPWPKNRDTIISGHLLASNHEHNLTSMGIEYLGIDISDKEARVKEAVTYIRRLVQRKDSPISNWRIAREGLPEMPSAKASTNPKKKDEECWKLDQWLPRAFAKWCQENDRPDLLPEGRDYTFLENVTAEYANTDSSTTLALHKQHMKLLEERKLMPIYNERMKLVRITQKMESRGVTIRADRLRELRKSHKEEIAKAERICVNIAKSYDYDLVLPKGGNNNSLTNFVFDVMKLPALSYTPTGQKQLNKACIEEYEVTLEPRSRELLFIQKLSEKRRRDTSVQYMDGYERFWLPLGIFNDKGEQLWMLLHPSLNITGTATLRWSSSNPNEQNISKRGMFEGDKRNLRWMFGPAPGREWWSMDAKNIELRIPAYESGEQELIDLFERPDDPPYYGSTHLLNFHTVYDDIWDAELKALTEEFGKQKVEDAYLAAWKKVGPHCKKKFASTWYQFCKNGGFAVQYGAVEAKKPGQIGTADKAFHKVGCHAKLKARFSKLEQHNQRCIAYANRHGYVETIPDKSISPERGYPILCTRSDRGKILETVPLNYRTQSTAMWWTARGMVRCDELLERWERSEGFDGFMNIQCHDELLFDFPRGKGSRPWMTNLDKAKQLSEAMAKGGEDIGIPTPVGIEYHPDCWAEGVTLQ